MNLSITIVNTEDVSCVGLGRLNSTNNASLRILSKSTSVVYTIPVTSTINNILRQSGVDFLFNLDQVIDEDLTDKLRKAINRIVKNEDELKKLDTSPEGDACNQVIIWLEILLVACLVNERYSIKSTS